VLLCASTRRRRELILDAYARASLPADVLLLIVPRHPQRFDEVEKLICRAVWRCSAGPPAQDDAVAAGTQVLLGDSMGEMFAYYAACDALSWAAACCRWAARI
jgi:3-deoxy-D-manno-octulosonic-acid transferase